jgi:predicted alpha/beta-hydrolase family hydrolase
MKTEFAWKDHRVSGYWHRPDGPPRATLVLGHGASYNMNTKQLVDVGEAMAKRGVAVLRFNFLYTEEGRRAPDPQPRLEACFRAVAEAVAGEFPRPFLGGRSMGGRIASHVVADGFPAAGLVFLAYPLHPPGKPERIRDAHLKAIQAPMLFLQGSRDPFARPDLLEATIKSLARPTLVRIEGGDHSFKVKGRTTEDVTAELIEAIDAFISAHASR